MPAPPCLLGLAKILRVPKSFGDEAFYVFFSTTIPSEDANGREDDLAEEEQG